MSEKRAYWLLAAAALCACFGPGYQELAICVILQPALLLVYVRWAYQRTATAFSSAVQWILLPVLALTIGGTVSFAGTFNDPDWEVGRVFWVMMLQLLLSFLAVLVCYVPTAVFEYRFGCPQPLQTLVFPVLYTTGHFLASRLAPFGIYGSPAITFHDWGTLVQLLSLVGTEGIVFLVGWTASLLSDILYETCLKQSNGISPPVASVAAAAGEAGDRVSRASISSEWITEALWQQYRGIVLAYISVWVFVLLFGGLRMHNLGDTFYQRNVETVVPDVIKASCVVSQQVVSPAELFRMTAEQAQQGRELIIWAEEALEIHSAKDEDTLVSNASKAAAELGIYLGVSYETSFQTAHRNMFVFYGPDGEQLIFYQKAFPVPLSESNVVPGKAELPIVETKWGKVGAAICFDYDFPQYIMEAGRQEAKLMLQPAWTWGPIAEYLFYGDAYRAVENGFTLFRCGSGGYSGVVDTRYRVYNMRPATALAAFAVDIPSSPHTFTFYPHGGFLFAWLVLAFACVVWALVLTPVAIIVRVLDASPGALRQVLVVRWAGRVRNPNLQYSTIA